MYKVDDKTGIWVVAIVAILGITGMLLFGTRGPGVMVASDAFAEEGADETLAGQPMKLLKLQKGLQKKIEAASDLAVHKLNDDVTARYIDGQIYTIGGTKVSYTLDGSDLTVRNSEGNIIGAKYVSAQAKQITVREKAAIKGIEVLAIDAQGTESLILTIPDLYVSAQDTTGRS